METLLLLCAATAFVLLNRQAQARRIALLGTELGQFQIEKLMESTVDGYLRALGEADPARQTQIWNLLAQAEANLANQLQNFAQAFSRLDAKATRFGTAAIALPFVPARSSPWLPFGSADMRALLTVHARGVAAAAQNAAGLGQKERAYMLTAELLLFQHTCHWFCRSKLVANARTLARHQTPYTQLLSAVSNATRTDYLRALG